MCSHHTSPTMGRVTAQNEDCVPEFPKHLLGVCVSVQASALRTNLPILVLADGDRRKPLYVYFSVLSNSLVDGPHHKS